MAKKPGKSADWAPERGELVWLDFTHQAGHEQAGRRPALVLSPREYNRKTGLMLACPITSRQKGYPFEVALPASSPVKGVVLADQVRSLDWRSRRAELAARTEDAFIAQVLDRLNLLLD